MVPKFCFNLIVQNFMCISCFIPELVESAELNPPSAQSPQMNNLQYNIMYQSQKTICKEIQI